MTLREYKGQHPLIISPATGCELARPNQLLGLQRLLRRHGGLHVLDGSVPDLDRADTRRHGRGRERNDDEVAFDLSRLRAVVENEDDFSCSLTVRNAAYPLIVLEADVVLPASGTDAEEGLGRNEEPPLAVPDCIGHPTTTEVKSRDGPWKTLI